MPETDYPPSQEEEVPGTSSSQDERPLEEEEAPADSLSEGATPDDAPDDTRTEDSPTEVGGAGPS